MNTSLRFRQSQAIAASFLVIGCGVHYSKAQQAAQSKLALARQSIVFRTGDFTIAASRGADRNTNRKTVVNGTVVVTTHHSKPSLEVQTTEGGLNLGYQSPAFLAGTKTPVGLTPVRLAFMPFDTSNMKVEFKGKATIFRDGSERILTVKPYPQS